MKPREGREDGAENRQVKRDRDKIDWLAGVIKRSEEFIRVYMCSPMKALGLF